MIKKGQVTFSIRDKKTGFAVRLGIEIPAEVAIREVEPPEILKKFAEVIEAESDTEVIGFFGEFGSAFSELLAAANAIVDEAEDEEEYACVTADGPYETEMEILTGAL